MKSIKSILAPVASFFLLMATFTVTSCNQEDNEPATVTDADDNVYQTVAIGNQVWMAENLRTTRYRNGDLIPYITDDTDWTNLSTPGYCWHANDAQLSLTLGALYNWYAIQSSANICPEGWHVPTNGDWQTLFDHLGGNSVAGGKLKEVGTLEDMTGYWYAPNTGATNESGFGARSGGPRSYSNGMFGSRGLNAYFWSSTELDVDKAYARALGNSTAGVISSSYDKRNGHFCRCVKD